MSPRMAGLLTATALATGLGAAPVRAEDAPGGAAAVPAAARDVDSKLPAATQGAAERKEFTKEEIKEALLKAATSAAKKANPGQFQINLGQ
ncbi:MAG: hypothetical protein NTW87_16815 [Planctomycetota bacterium]|nr:hypothetical protein [Planctomycetota bacterium]